MEGPFYRLIAALFAIGSASASPMIIFIGSYKINTWVAGAPVGHGIYASTLDPQTGVLSAPVLAAETPDPVFLELDPQHHQLYSADGHEASVSAFAIDAVGRLSLINRQSTGGVLVPYLALDRTGRMVIVPDYGGGFVCVFPILAGGALGPRSSFFQHSGPPGPDRSRQSHPVPHSVAISPDNRFALVCDLGLDRVLTYRVDPPGAAISPSDPAFIAVPAGAGPRRGVFSPDGHFFYVVDEMGNSICGFAYDSAGGVLALRQVVSTLPAGYHGTSRAAEIAVHPNGRFVYASNRGDDSLAIFARESESGALRLLETVASGGAVPRHFALSEDGRWLVCANQRGGNVVVFRVDSASGGLERVPGEISVPNAACVLFYN